MAVVMAIGFSLFDDRHGPEVFFPASVVRQPGVAPGHLDAAVAQELLQTLQTHAGVQQFGGTGVPETMEAVALMRQAGGLQVFSEPHADGGVTQAWSPLTVKQTFFGPVSYTHLR